MKRTSLLVVGGLVLVPSVMFAQSFDDPGTEYSQATSGSYTRELSNDFIRNVKSFGCLIENSRPDFEQNVNARYLALLDEVECGLSEGNGSTAPVYAKAVIQSSRASNDTDQEIQLWFDSADGSRYIANTVLKSSKATVPPFGEWYMSFYKSASAGGTDAPFNVNSSDTGFAKIDFDGTDLKINYADRAAGGNYGLSSTLIYRGNNPNDVDFLGVVEERGSTPIYMAGQVNSNSYYRAVINPIDGSVVSGMDVCLDRNAPWVGSENVGLYYKTASTAAGKNAGDELELNSAFNFQYSGAYGNYNEHGIWTEVPVDFTPASNSISVTKSDGSARSILWSPGKLYKITDVTIPLVEGDSFTWFGSISVDRNLQSVNSQPFGKYTAVFQGANTQDNQTSFARFKLVDSNWSTAGYLLDTAQSWEKGFWSEMYRADVKWSSGATATYQRRDHVNADAVFAASTQSLTCQGGWCLESSSANPLPITRSAYVGSSGSGNWDKLDNWKNSQTGGSYIFSGASPASGFEAMTLYWDADASSSLTGSDFPVRFDFRIDDNGAANYRDFGSGSATGSWSRQTNYSYPEIQTYLSDGTSTYLWSSGPDRWYNTYSLYNNGTPDQIERPRVLVSTLHLASNDLNANRKLTGLFNENDGGPLPISNSGNSPFCSSTGDATMDTAGYAYCEFPQSMWNGKKYVVSYDGQRLQNIPYAKFYYSPGNADWSPIVNFKNGAEFTDPATNQVFVLKNKMTSEALLRDQQNSCSTSGLSFTNLSEIGLGLSDLPSVIDVENYPRPTQVWTDKPEPDAGSCTVKQGVISCD